MTITAPTIDTLRGRITDLDSHWMLFPKELAGIFGLPADKADRLLGRFAPKNEDRSKDGMFTDRTLADEAMLTESRSRARTDVWNVKGWGAHGAQIAADRLDALDQMGVSRQLVFPTGMWPAMHTDKFWGPAAVQRYNDSVLDWAEADADCLRPACLVNTTDVDVGLTEARRVIDRGARLIQFACSKPWAGMSPAASDWEPLWAMLAAARVPGLFHIGGQGDFVPRGWAKGARNMQFAPKKDSDPGEVFGPFHMTTIHMPAETALSTMVFGGVFERHPELRFGVIEMGANWVAGWCERMDMTAETFARQLAGSLPSLPSEYVRRQIRVTPYYHEPVGRWLERHPDLADVYVFSTDFPHPEGGKDPIEKFLGQVAPLGADLVEKFFVTNGLALLPD